MAARVYVLTGVNGAGKSSIGGAKLRLSGAAYYNPDEEARRLQGERPSLTLEEANAQAWEFGRRGLQRALAEGGNFAFETTLGASTIPHMLLNGAKAGAAVHVWFAGLASPELHIKRVAARVAAGGHPIPEGKIRERYEKSRANLIMLMPHLASLRVYDNSQEADPKKGKRPEPVLLLHTEKLKVLYPKKLGETPQWAKPLLAAAFSMADAGGEEL